MTLLTVAIAASLLLAVPARADTLVWHDWTYTTHEAQPRTITGQEARLTLPENPRHPGGPMVELEVIRLPATTPHPGAPTVYLHGGPGGSSAEHLEQPEFRAVFDSLRTGGDVVLFDQRGCGKSTPTLLPVGAPRVDAATLVTRGAFLDYLSRCSEMVRDRLRAAGHDPQQYTVLQSVEDLERLRQALGVARINVFGHSYGTQLAQAFVRAYPMSVAHMVLAGSRGMDTSRKLPAEADAFLARIAALARADTTVGERFPDLLATLDHVLARVDHAPVGVTIDNVHNTTLQVGGYALRFIIAKFYLNDPDNFRYLPKLLDEIDTGRTPWSLGFNVIQIVRGGVSFAWFTTDGASGVTAARAATIRDQAKSARLGDAMNFPFPDIDKVWRMNDLGDAFRSPVGSDVPVLFVAGTLDGITPVEQTRQIMAGFRNARLLTVTNGGHSSQLRAPGVAGTIADFMAGRTPADHVELPQVGFMPLVRQRAAAGE